MFAFEHRWAAAVLSGFAPAHDEPRGPTPRPGEIDWAEGAKRFLARASAKGRLGVRVGLLLVVTAPLWCWGRAKTALGLSPDERARLLDELLAHRLFLVRELCLLLKLVACMALFAAPAVRDRASYDPPSEPARRLPVLERQAALEQEVA